MANIPRELSNNKLVLCDASDIYITTFMPTAVPVILGAVHALIHSHNFMRGLYCCVHPSHNYSSPQVLL